jgi:hypothetical protein
MLLRYDGQEMALIVNEKHVVPFQANRWRCVSKKKEVVLGRPTDVADNFGNALILLAGDCRQKLPVLPRSTPADEINACKVLRNPPL